MVRTNTTNQSATRSSVFFGDDTPPARQSMRSPVPSQAGPGPRATSPALSTASSTGSRFSQSGRHATQSSFSFGSDDRDRRDELRERERFGRDDHYPPTPPQPLHQHQQQLAHSPRPPPSPITSLTSAVAGTMIGNSDAPRIEVLFAEMQAKLDAQNALLLDMFSYIRRIDKDVGSIGDEVSVLRSRLERL
ncbi:UNVERIFIED_CONTAM: hypothetical protein HDU68_011797 [Siphonaria sp. JEL0065]|nr:hypothetical protein HDU68_011797 [Siphonaria sp. JEL0065]